MKVAAIVPAYNEAKRLKSVLEAIRQASLVDEIIVVNDGSTDDTGAVASTFPGATVINLPHNHGKGGAMYSGATSTDAEAVVFLDADLIGITGDQIDNIVRPVVEGQIDMCIGVFRGGRRVTDLAQVIAPYISGQRAVQRQIFLDVVDVECVRSGVEVALTKHFRMNGLKMGTVTLTGCTHVMKEEKLGWPRGSAARLRMYYEIGKIVLGLRRNGAKHGHPAGSSRKLRGREQGTGNRE